MTATTTRPRWVCDRSKIPDPLGHGERAVRFLGALRHPKSDEADRRLKLAPEWERIVRRIYGPRTATGERIVRTVFLMMPRGARKTTVIGGGLGLLHSIGPERRPDGQALLAAGAEDQAELAFNEATSMVKATPALKKRVKVRADYLEHPEAGSTLRVLSADGDVSHGTTPDFVEVDELHVWKNRRLWKALRTGLIKVKGTLLIITTTAGRGQAGLAWDEYQYARRVALGEIDNPSYLPIIFEPEAGDDWQDERVWHRVNPFLHLGFPDLDAMRALAIEVRDKPADLDDFKQYNLNFWLDQSLSPFVAMAVYDRGAEPIDVEALKGRECVVCVDMSTTTDLTAIVAAFPDDDGGFTILAHFFCPEDSVARRRPGGRPQVEEDLAKRAERDQAPYQQWAKEGHLTPTPGNVIDYTAIVAKLREFNGLYRVREFGFDKAYAQPVMQPLMDDGLNVVTIQQGWFTQAPAVRELERAIVAGKFRHGGNPVLRWCFGNVSVHTDSNNNRTFHKGKSRDRIDGATASWMAVSRAAAKGQDGRSIYERAEIWDAPPQAGEPANDDGRWSPEILQDVNHPLHAEHRQRFETWQDARADEDW